MSEAIDAIRGHINQAPIPKAKCLLDERDRVNAMIDAIEAENAKLRELVRHMYECMGNIDADGNHECDSCEYDNKEGKCDYERQMRELGIEVDG